MSIGNRCGWGVNFKVSFISVHCSRVNFWIYNSTTWSSIRGHGRIFSPQRDDIHWSQFQIWGRVTRWSDWVWSPPVSQPRPRGNKRHKTIHKSTTYRKYFEVIPFRILLLSAICILGGGFFPPNMLSLTVPFDRWLPYMLNTWRNQFARIIHKQTSKPTKYPTHKQTS